MKTLVIYYSHTGKTRKLATETAKKENADLVEIKMKKPYSKFGAYIKGGRASMKQRSAEIEEFKCNFADYDKIVIAGPIWAGLPAPPVNSVIRMLPAGKDVALIFSSGGGNTSKNAAKIKDLVINQGCIVVGYDDVKG